ncbi:PcfJ-like protein [Fodinibius roseus]|uniref:PcfJ-like protein n=2 Tax=Fodinibius roseus TaxID=1194090 RepID=A0A1M5KM30_9BACT|nr:PcfJ-like protein [Fodinibius roseus]
MTEEQKQWANDALFRGYYVQVRNRNFCLECGHKWNPECKRLGKRTCPSCGTKGLKHVDHWDTDKSIYRYWAKIDMVEGCQVVRMFFAEKYLKRKQTPKYYHQEVMQHWVREDGKITSMAKLCSTMGACRRLDSWSPGTDLEVRTNSRNHQMRCNIIPDKICPGRNTLPIIRRNGYKGYFRGEAPHHFFSAILKYPKVETLLKAGQHSLFSLCVGMGDYGRNKVRQYWKSICIAMRNDYIVEDASDWLDYLGMLEQFDKDILNAEYICPDDLHKAHNHYNSQLQEVQIQQMLERDKEKIKKENVEYRANKGQFFNMRFRNKNIKIEPLTSVQQFLIEGKKLKHCIYTNSYYKRDNSLMLSARISGELVETVEVNLRKMEVSQARGFKNKPTEHHKKIVDTVRENMDKIAKRANTEAVAA